MFSRVAIRNLKVARRFSTVAPRVWDKFDNFVKERPVLAKCMVGGALAFIADLVTQVGLSDAVSKKKYDEITIDWLRVLKFSAIGGLFVPPILHCWYGFLVARIPGVTVSSVLKRLALDQLCFAPVFLPCFISVAMFLDGKADQIPAKLKADWFPTVVANYSVWVPCQFINFRYVAPHQQVLFANAVSFFWNIYLSYTCYDNSDKATDAVAAVQAIVNAPTTSSTTAKAVQVIADEVSVAKAKEDLSPPPASEPVNEVAAVVMQSVTAVEEEPKETSVVVELKEDDLSIDKAGIAPVEFVEATMPPEVSAEMSEEDAKGQTVMLGGEDVVCEKVTIYAMGVEEVDDSEVMEIEIVEAKEEEEK